MQLSRHKILIVGMVIPVVFVLVIIGIIMVPRFLYSPQYDFLYATGDTYYFDDIYSVRNNKIIKSPVNYTDKTSNDSEPRIYHYSISNDTVTEISYEEAQQFTLDSRSKSPDGFSIECSQESNAVFFLVFDSNQNCTQQIIKGHGVNQRLDIDHGTYRYNDIDFIGWVTTGKL